MLQDAVKELRSASVFFNKLIQINVFTQTRFLATKATRNFYEDYTVTKKYGCFVLCVC